MALRSMIVLVALLVVASQAEAQLAGLPALSGLLGIININGTIFCSLTGSIIPNAATQTPVFPNAVVQVSCGGNVVASAITNASGAFNIVLDPIRFLLTNVLSNCNVVVNTPLANCNANLPSTGVLQAPLQLAGNTIRGLLSVFTLIPSLFQLVNV